jgi:hypothetical protein
MMPVDSRDWARRRQEMNTEYMNRWNRRMAEEVRDEEAMKMQEQFEQELVLSANSAQYEVLYALGEVDS